MYLEKINTKFSSYIGSYGIKGKVIITNTCKLNMSTRMYMLEFQYNGNLYHLYHVVGESVYELRLLNEAYDKTNFEDVFGISASSCIDFMKILNLFMLENYEGIQTYVDCKDGLEKAKKEIQKVRLQQLSKLRINTRNSNF